jgi:Flp pilus assembly protein TadD
MLVATLLVTTACASGTRSLSDRFVTHGAPTMDLGGPKLVLPGNTREASHGTLEALRAADVPSAGGTRAVAQPLSSLEATSPRLQRALHALALAQTTENYLATARAYVAEGVRDRAYDYLAAGLERDQRSATLHDATARLWRDWGMHDRALRSAHAAVYFAPRSAEARNTLGTVLWALGQRTEAGQAFTEAADLAPGAWYAWQNLCQVTLTAGRTRMATTYCQHAAQLKIFAERHRP